MNTSNSDLGQALRGSERAPWLQPASRRYGALLGFADDQLVGLWCGPARWKQVLFRVYCRIFGYPELAAHRRYPYIRRALASRDAARVVDIGARNGLYILADAVRRPQTHYVAVDISLRHLQRVNRAAKQFGVRVYPLKGSVEELGLPLASVDLVLTIEVLQFVQDDRRAVMEIARVLRPGGTWWCEQELGTGDAISGGSEDPTLVKRRQGHSVDGLTKLARAAGLRLDTVQDVERTIGRWWEGLESRIVKRGLGIQIIAFPMLRALAALTANRWTDRVPSTKLYCFVKESLGLGESTRAASGT